MDKKISTQLEELQQTVTSLAATVANLAANMVTKEDAKEFFTKEDAKNDIATFATKDDISQLRKELKSTKSDLRNHTNTKITSLRKELLEFKKDLMHVKRELIEEIKESEGFIVASVDRNKADKRKVEELDKRVTRLEQKVAA